MRAIIINNFGGRDQLQMAEVPRPVPGKGEVLIRVRAAGCNPVDTKIREGLLRFRLPHQFPIIPGWDVAGVVEEIGEGGRQFDVGDEVYAYCRKPVIMHGAYCEYVAVHWSHVAMKPQMLSFEQAAAIPLAGLTAYQSLFEVGELKVGEVVLVHAAAGGVGHFAVQLARGPGRKVIATTSERNMYFVSHDLRAHHVIDYTRQDFVKEVRTLYPDGIDLAFDTVGGDVQERSADVLKPGGRLVSILAFANEAMLRAKGADCRYHFVQPNGTHLRKLANLADAGKLKVEIAAVLPLEDAAKAHEMLESRHTRGKIVLKVAD
jgi:NADPH2:quinone reductase